MTYPAYGAPPPNLRQPSRVELFFLTHAETGEPLVHGGALGVALAGAVLVDELLRPEPRIRLVGELVVVTTSSFSGDPVADWAVRTLDGRRMSALETSRPTQLRAALRALAVDAYQRTAAGLVAGDLVQEVTRRRALGGRRRYPPSDAAVIARVRGRLCSVLTGHTAPDPQTCTLGGLMLALNLTAELYLDGTGLDLRALLSWMVGRVGAEHPAVQQVITATDHLIAETAVAVYR
ncbi:GPP34 family phosphoprotein [Dactylosporangium aurantiacum]|uniref:GPP34 family phosphoprotein n=1 Tax=Dactylosporangium aurantiacum TaxID=35754 RepID=A0A9Q9IFR7_9ACTN|nr:GPP34 family phosphoprotein [Dactylosporangium aurantiacum]MDG6100504.1 GPP34 family phosphoprotein [Dactylosporangium aurantiacum]UWZ55394.1 GPP34 family phosphoprotein [Dactylosporangium aurantiacum]